MTAATDKVLSEVYRERLRQDEKWNEQNHPDGTGTDWTMFGESGSRWLEFTRVALEQSTKPGCQWAEPTGWVTVPPTGPTWLLIALEEVFEALVEADPKLLRAELVQAAAVMVAWIEAIDRRVEIDKDLRYPADRPGWLGEYQAWPCGRCGREVDDSDRHDCQPQRVAVSGA